jgi:hypothetical protein
MTEVNADPEAIVRAGNSLSSTTKMIEDVSDEKKGKIAEAEERIGKKRDEQTNKLNVAREKLDVNMANYKAALDALARAEAQAAEEDGPPVPPQLYVEVQNAEKEVQKGIAKINCLENTLSTIENAGAKFRMETSDFESRFRNLSDEYNSKMMGTVKNLNSYADTIQKSDRELRGESGTSSGGAPVGGGSNSSSGSSKSKSSSSKKSGSTDSQYSSDKNQSEMNMSEGSKRKIPSALENNKPDTTTPKEDNVKMVLPSNDNVVWEGDPGDSLCAHKDQAVRKLIEDCALPGTEPGDKIPFRKGQMDMSGHSCTFNGIPLTTETSAMTDERTGNPSKSFYGTEDRTGTAKYSDDSEYDFKNKKELQEIEKDHGPADGYTSLDVAESGRKIVLPFDNDKKMQTLIREQKAHPDVKFRIASTAESSNFEIADAHMAEKLNISQLDLADMIDGAGKAQHSDKVGAIAEKYGLDDATKDYFLNNKITRHERYDPDTGKFHIDYVRSDLHKAIHHEGGVKEIDRRKGVTDLSGI